MESIGGALPSGMVALHDPERGFDERILSVAGDIYLNGFWQSERYFAPIADIIRRELTFRCAPSAKNQALLDEIHSTEAVALHVRRSDYLSLPAYGACGPDYYHRAIDHLLLQVRNPHFFIFSDDPEWTRLHIKPKGACTYIDHNTGKQDFEDLRLMSQCGYFIIANSTFSWWGAWLSENKAKRIICPQGWYTDPWCRSTPDLIPDSWLRI